MEKDVPGHICLENVLCYRLCDGCIRKAAVGSYICVLGAQLVEVFGEAGREVVL